MPNLAATAVLLCASLGIAACSNNDQPSIEAFCSRLETAFGPQGALSADYSEDPNSAQAVVDELEDIRRVAPLEVEPSLVIINNMANQIVAAFGDPNTTAIDPQHLQESGLAAAELSNYSTQNCGLDLDWNNPVVLEEPNRIPGEINLEVPG